MPPRQTNGDKIKYKKYLFEKELFTAYKCSSHRYTSNFKLLRKFIIYV